MKNKLDINKIPQPVYNNNPALVELYYLAWEQAWKHVKVQEGIPQSPYMDEGLWDDTIWIWDTCFMTLFCKYSPDIFPGVESLRNFYLTLHDNSAKEKISLNIQHPDNPPLFAWSEYDNFMFTGDTEHVSKLLLEERFLQKHFDWFDNCSKGWQLISGGNARNSVPTELKKVANGYLWGNIQSGMDNTPRTIPGMRWFDAVAQQGLSALYISRLAKRIGATELSELWMEKYNDLKKLVNDKYWSESDGIYYDLKDDGSLSNVVTPASFWPMMAEMCSPEQAVRLAEYLTNPNLLGGDVPWVSVARNHPEFDEIKNGDYWRGAVWIPMAYMGIKALEKYELYSTADESAAKLLSHMLKTYQEYKPQTIWECYSPVAACPSENHGERVREDFCGWSALGPISLFIENILGFRQVDALNKIVTWKPANSGFMNGIRNLRFGNIVTDIIMDEDGSVMVTSNQEYTLHVNSSKVQIFRGKNLIDLEDFRHTDNTIPYMS